VIGRRDIRPPLERLDQDVGNEFLGQMPVAAQYDSKPQQRSLVRGHIGSEIVRRQPHHTPKDAATTLSVERVIKS
jgi:hypothetical protein